ncbi:MAG: hypothetical protein BWX80_02134 [Candidatus Hydrogenedentes bacterium ADurb.Bin101]|nr:MAG: hypothetical protein BWX80_02134 [Candidatus Hydrogenedentes bacterium ADurb.Bin101]
MREIVNGGYENHPQWVRVGLYPFPDIPSQPIPVGKIVNRTHGDISIIAYPPGAIQGEYHEQQGQGNQPFRQGQGAFAIEDCRAPGNGAQHQPRQHTEPGMGVRSCHCFHGGVLVGEHDIIHQDKPADVVRVVLDFDHGFFVQPLRDIPGFRNQDISASGCQAQNRYSVHKQIDAVYVGMIAAAGEEVDIVVPYGKGL